MATSLLNIMASLSYLHFKHLLCDFPLQTTYELKYKGIYGHVGGLAHAATHALGTLPVFFLLTPSVAIMVSLIAAEFALHYHIDWTKEFILRRARWTTANFGFWQIFGVDQFLHYLTYTAMVGILVMTS